MKLRCSTEGEKRTRAKNVWIFISILFTRAQTYKLISKVFLLQHWRYVGCGFRSELNGTNCQIFVLRWIWIILNHKIQVYIQSSSLKKCVQASVHLQAAMVQILYNYYLCKAEKAIAIGGQTSQRGFWLPNWLAGWLAGCLLWRV